MSIKCNSKDLLWSKNHYLKNSSNFRGVKTTLATMSILSANCSTFLSNKSGKQPLKCTKMCAWWPQIDLRRWKVNQTNRKLTKSYRLIHTVFYHLQTALIKDISEFFIHILVYIVKSVRHEAKMANSFVLLR